MEFKISIVAKKDNKWFAGYLDGFNFKENMQIKKLKDVKNITSYITFKNFLKNENKDPSLEKLILEKTNLQSIYVLDVPIEPSKEEFKNYWWKDINNKCKDCKMDCKQSSKVTIIRCQKDI